MFYRKFNPSAHLTPFVACYFVWESQDIAPKPLRIESPPSGYASMVFNFGDAYQVENSKHESLMTPAMFLTGQATQSYSLNLSGRIGMVGIVFKPAGMSSLFGLPMYEFTDERVDLTDVLGKSLTNVQGPILEAGNPVERVQLLEQFLLRQLAKKNPSFDRTDYTANLIVERKGVVNVSELMDDLYVCRRQFERQFLQKVGISPKYYARVRRVGHLCAQLASQRWQINDWHELIYQCGYYDQSHFIREFTQFTGKRPSLYVKDNQELTRFLDT
ncbi:helix-turn-helix transcriptional regulator [Spirosoma spitsbergense]|uniref:helix-turn-helix transcriptional regulator n=1 Tax=Spirosoma spitsbergense TaxID=431554 RepID=UPI000477FB89|nr:helix-turn-helix transcriptional regulator [Spirosoma spitsbergense]